MTVVFVPVVFLAVIVADPGGSWIEADDLFFGTVTLVPIAGSAAYLGLVAGVLAQPPPSDVARPEWAKQVVGRAKWGLMVLIGATGAVSAISVWALSAADASLASNGDYAIRGLVQHTPFGAALVVTGLTAAGRAVRASSEPGPGGAWVDSAAFRFGCFAAMALPALFAVAYFRVTDWDPSFARADVAFQGDMVEMLAWLVFGGLVFLVFHLSRHEGTSQAPEGGPPPTWPPP